MRDAPGIGRRLAAGAIVLLLLGPVAGCAAGGSAADERPTVLTTFTILADIARNVAGKHLRVESITKVGAEIHGYQPTPGDIKKAAQADLIVDNGLGLEAWFAQFVEGIDVPHVVASDGVKPVDITEDAYAGQPNPHAWMSPRNVEIYVDNLADAFADLDPQHASAYRANAKAYEKQLGKLHDDLVAELRTLPENQRALVTCEGAFSYLTRDTGMSERYLWAVNAEQQATPKQIAGTIDFVRQDDVPAVFCESTVSDRAMRQVVEATDARFGGTLYVDSLSQKDGPVPTYLDLIEYDANLIVKGLKGTAG